MRNTTASDAPAAVPSTSPPPARPVRAGRPSALDRRSLFGLTVEQWIYIAVFAVAVGTRVYDLGVRPYHHDESIHAVFSWKITTEGVGSYKYDPVYHGPWMYYTTALVLLLFGDSDFTGRLSAVFHGFGIMALAWPLRRYMGRSAALWFVVLVTFSPAWTYFTRFLRHDIYVAFGNLLAVYGGFRYADTRSARYLYASFAGLAIAFTNKEDMYALGPIFVVALVAMLAWEVVYAQDWRGELKAVRAETSGFLRQAAIPLITGVLVFATIWLVLYTSFFSHPKNWNAVTPALKYWWGQHEIKRIGGPWWYYLPQFFAYEPLIFFTGIAFAVGPFFRPGPRANATRVLGYITYAAFGAFVVSLFAWESQASHVLMVALTFLALALMRRWLPDRFTRFSIVWTLGCLVFYAWAQEKVPWLLVPMLLPLTILAAKWFAHLTESGALGRPATALPLAAVGAFTLWTLVAVNYLHDAPRPSEGAPRHAELLPYVQSTYDVTDVVVRRVEEIADKLGTGTKTRLAISGNATWPLSWYLRHYPVNWSADVRQVDTPVVVVDREATNALDKALGDAYERIDFQIRGWWEPDWKGMNVPKVTRWLLTREAFNPVGSSDAVLYAFKNPAPGTAFAAVPVNPPPPARGYPAQPRFLSPVAIWGTKGTGNGQFDEPRAMGVDGNGNLYVVDSKNNRIQKFGADGTHLLTWGGEGDAPGKFKDPCGIAVTAGGTVYVADTWNHRIQKFDADGKFILEWRAEKSFWGPRGVAVAPDGETVYVTDTGNKRVVRFDAIGKELGAWGRDGSKPGEFIEPVGIVVDRHAQVYVADTGNKRIQVFDPDGKALREFIAYGWDEFYTEPYLALLGDDLLTTDSYNHRAARYSAEGKYGYAWGKSGADKGAFNRPIGIAADAQGMVYVADTMNNRIQKFELPPLDE